MAKTIAFDRHLQEYEEWFHKNYWAYQSELAAVKKLLPSNKEGLEIGMGSGLFAKPLGIKSGIEPSREMRQKAEERGMFPIEAIAESLPFADESFDFALMVTTICFVDDPALAYKEIWRILKPGGTVITGFVDKGSPLGKNYQANKQSSLFYGEAEFFSSEEIIMLLKAQDFETGAIYQTVFGLLSEIKELQPPKEGYGEGNFVVIEAKKTRRIK